MVVIDISSLCTSLPRKRKTYSILDLKNHILPLKMSMKQNGITGVMVLIRLQAVVRSKKDT